MGGGFGGKETQPHGFAAIAALGATVTGRPVRVRLNRNQDITITGKAPGFDLVWKAGFDDDGMLVALTATMTADGGWSIDLMEAVLSRALCHIDNAYWIPAIEVHGRIVKTNKVSHTAFRGFGGPQGILLIEDVFGQCAPALGIDAAELRRRNFYAPGQTTPFGQIVKDAERMPAIWSQLLDSSAFERRSTEVAAFNADERAREARAGHHPGEIRHLVQQDRCSTRPERSSSSIWTARCSSITAAPRWARGSIPRCCRSRPPPSGSIDRRCVWRPPAPTRSRTRPRPRRVPVRT